MSQKSHKQSLIMNILSIYIVHFFPMILETMKHDVYIYVYTKTKRLDKLLDQLVGCNSYLVSKLKYPFQLNRTIDGSTSIFLNDYLLFDLARSPTITPSF